MARKSDSIVESSGGEHICVCCTQSYEKLENALACAENCWRSSWESHSAKAGALSVEYASINSKVRKCEDRMHEARTQLNKLLYQRRTKRRVFGDQHE